jgi:hypothetical protein
MRMTIDIPEALLGEIRRRAESRSASIDTVVVDALRSEFQSESDAAEQGEEVQEQTPSTGLITFGPTVGGGLQPGLAWDDWETMKELSRREMP